MTLALSILSGYFSLLLRILLILFPSSVDQTFSETKQIIFYEKWFCRNEPWHEYLTDVSNPT